eukprot:1157278-Pelagomonas_calceolata.AAC.4
MFHDCRSGRCSGSRIETSAPSKEYVECMKTSQGRQCHFLFFTFVLQGTAHKQSSHAKAPFTAPYMAQLTRKSAITALCMYDRDDVEEAQRSPGAFPNIDLLHRVYNEGLELDFCVQEFEV